MVKDVTQSIKKGMTLGREEVNEEESKKERKEKRREGSKFNM